MAGFTTIAMATVAVGSSVFKGVQASNAASAASRKSGQLALEQQKLERESVARLEANYYDAVRATTDIYDKQLQLSNVQGSQILEAAQEGDQRGVAATAGKVKLAQDIASGQVADKMAQQKLDIDLKRAEASEKDASEIAAMFDDRAAAAGLQSMALAQQAEDLKGEATGAFMDAGVAALSAGVTAFGGGKAKKDLINDYVDKGYSLEDANRAVDELGFTKGKQYRQFNRYLIDPPSSSMTGGASVSAYEENFNALQGVNAFNNKNPEVAVDDSVQAAINAAAEKMLKEKEGSNPILNGPFGNGFTNIFESFGLIGKQNS
jgi:hypothetical protein